MTELPPTPNFQWLVDAYFSDPNNSTRLDPGQTLLEAGTFNDRLFYLRTGLLKSTLKDAEGRESDFFEVTAGDFVGISSFFSRTFRSFTRVVAVETSVLSHIDSKTIPRFDGTNSNLSEQFMPVIIRDLFNRQLRAATIHQEKENLLKKLQCVDKMAALGQLAAGVAHELNNSLSVLLHGTRFIGETLETLIDPPPLGSTLFAGGLNQGRRFSTSEARARRKIIGSRFSLPDPVAEKLSWLPFSLEEIAPLVPELARNNGDIIKYFETGVQLNDMRLAATQAEHVITSMKVLGTGQLKRVPGVDLNETIGIALSLLKRKTDRCRLTLDLEKLPPIIGNRGELVQVWINLIKNSVEALADASSPDPGIIITTRRNSSRLEVKVEDNGPGISPDNLLHIFEPQFTTKNSGHNVGLGLGLAITARIIAEYGGTISVMSNPGKTQFTISLPEATRHE